jgi:hypothetical protein
MGQALVCAFGLTWLLCICLPIHFPAIRAGVPQPWPKGPAWPSTVCKYGFIGTQLLTFVYVSIRTQPNLITSGSWKPHVPCPGLKPHPLLACPCLCFQGPPGTF